MHEVAVFKTPDFLRMCYVCAQNNNLSNRKRQIQQNIVRDIPEFCIPGRLRCIHLLSCKPGGDLTLAKPCRQSTFPLDKETEQPFRAALFLALGDQTGNDLCVGVDDVVVCLGMTDEVIAAVETCRELHLVVGIGASVDGFQFAAGFHIQIDFN